MRNKIVRKTYVAESILVLILAALIASVGARADLTGSGSSMDAELLYYQPVPAHPGDLLDVWVQIQNNGGTATKPGKVFFFDSGPFRIENNEDRVKEFPSIPANSNFLIKTEIRVDKNANEGDNYLRISVQEGDSNNRLEKDLIIPIVGRSGSLTITSVEANPPEAIPGGEVELKIKVKNAGETNVRNLRLSLTLDNFAPIGGSNSQTIKELKPGEEQTFIFRLASYPDTEPKAYQIPVTIEYEDEEGNEKTQNEVVGLIVSDEPDVIVYFDRISYDQKSGEYSVDIKFVNKGLSEIKFVTMDVIESESLRVTSESSRVYIGNIDSDDYETASIMVASRTNELRIPIAIYYKDALNREYSMNITLSQEVNIAKEKRSGWVLIAAIVVIAACIAIILRKKRKR